MREIKFRAWNKGINRMFSAEEMGEDELIINPDGRGFVNVNSTSTKLSQYYPHMIPLQYTGLKDKNGKEIYEDDIVKDCFIHIDPDNLDDRYLDGVERGTIVWYKCGFWIRVENQLKPSWPRHHQIISKWIKVIGNIHENPELLLDVVS